MPRIALLSPSIVPKSRRARLIHAVHLTNEVIAEYIANQQNTPDSDFRVEGE